MELGVNHIDTAAFYVSPGGTLGVGTGDKRYATELIRSALRPYPEDLLIATKVGPSEQGCSRSAAQLREQGLIRHLGLSAARLAHVDEAQAIALVVCVQNSYGLDYHRGRDELVRACGERGIAFVSFFTLAGDAREGARARARSRPALPPGTAGLGAAPGPARAGDPGHGQRRAPAGQRSALTIL